MVPGTEPIWTASDRWTMCQANYLNNYRTVLHPICRVVEERPELAGMADKQTKVSFSIFGRGKINLESTHLT